MLQIKPFDRRGFKAHIRQLTRDFRTLRVVAEQAHLGLDFNRPAEEVEADISKWDKAYRIALVRFLARYPQGVWPVVFARRLLAADARQWTFETPFAKPQKEIRGIVKFAPALALQLPVSKPLLEVLRPLMIEVHRWWMASQEGSRYASGKQRYPNRDLLQAAYHSLIDDFRELVGTEGANQSLRQRITFDEITDALGFFRLELQGYAENWIGEDWAAGRVADSWVRPGWPPPEDIEEILRLLNGRGPGFGPVEAARAALRGAMGIDGADLRGEESLRKLLRESSGKPRRPRSEQAAEQGTPAAGRRRARGLEDSGRKPKRQRD